MAWRYHDRRFCISCGRERADGEWFSARGKCYDCGQAHSIRNAVELAAHRGPYFERWRRAVAACVGGVLVEDLADDA